MAQAPIPYPTPGVASFELSDEYVNQNLLRGSDPKLEPAVSGLAGADIRRFEAVGFNSSGEVVPATWHASTPIKPIGIACHAAEDASRVLYWIAGHFNSDMILFDSSFDSDAKKLAAFNGAPSPTRIRLDPRFG